MRFIIVVFLGLLSSGLIAQDFRSHILVLASDSLNGRAPGTVHERKAGDYISSQFKSDQISVLDQVFAVYDDSTKSQSLLPDSAINIIGFLNLHRDSTIILSAHYDHLGAGNSKSKEIGKSGIHHGADDNASGVSLLIELARSFCSDTSLKYNFIFTAYSAHEIGLFGSDYFANSSILDSTRIKAVINFDMVGRLDRTSNMVRVSGVDSDPAFRQLFDSLTSNQLHFRFDDSNLLHSDLKPFALLGFPVLNLTTGIHADYHRMSDTEDKINYEGLSEIFSATHRLVYYLSGGKSTN